MPGLWGSTLIETLWRYVFCAAIAVLLLALLYHHWQIIVAPVPLDLYEGTMLLVTGIIADGDNPYTRVFQPYAADVYPPLYNLLVAPLSLIFGNTFALHRAVSAVFILLACATAGLATARRSGSGQHGAAAAAMLYAALLFYATPVSSTNAPGVAVFLAGLVIPWWRGFSNGSLAVALLCGLLVFYTKQYFILGMAILCLYLFLYVSMTRALLLGVVYAVLLLASVAIVHYFSPYYLDNTLFAPSAAMQGLQTWEILILQLRMYLHTYAGLLIIMLLSGAYWLFNAGVGASLRRAFARWQPGGTGWKGPLLDSPADFFAFCLLWASLVIIFSLGKNPGNYMTYLFQLMSPFLLIVGFTVVAMLPLRLKVAAPLVLLSFYQSYAILHKDFSADMEPWGRVEHMIADSDEVLASQMLVKTLLQYDKKVYQDGHTFYVPLAINKPDWMLKPREEDRIVTVWSDYITELYRKIERQEFDLILVSPWEMRGIFLRNPPPFEDIEGKKFLSRYYAVDEKIKLSMTDRHGGGTYELFVWRPRLDPNQK
jgi:hypothetical protein